jgi:hypothetical protein
MGASIRSVALREPPVVDRQIQDSKNLLFFCFHQAQTFCTASPDESVPNVPTPPKTQEGIL